jgi:DNA-directed RNA polymerase specialized sigma24 family protein
MTDRTGAAPSAGPTDRILTELFTDLHDRLVAFLREAGAGTDLAEDLAMETWTRVIPTLNGWLEGRDAARAWPVVTAQAALVAEAHAATREVAVDFTGAAAELLPQSPSAEDEALTHLTARDLAADVPAPWGVAA